MKNADAWKLTIAELPIPTSLPIQRLETDQSNMMIVRAKQRRRRSEVIGLPQTLIDLDRSLESQLSTNVDRVLILDTALQQLKEINAQCPEMKIDVVKRRLETQNFSIPGDLKPEVVSIQKQAYEWAVGILLLREPQWKELDEAVDDEINSIPWQEDMDESAALAANPDMEIDRGPCTTIMAEVNKWIQSQLGMS